MDDRACKRCGYLVCKPGCHGKECVIVAADRGGVWYFWHEGITLESKLSTVYVWPDGIVRATPGEHGRAIGTMLGLGPVPLPDNAVD